jgi:hypothetical protein
MNISREVALWLANIEGEGATDKEFAETIMLAYKMKKTGDAEAVLTKDDIVNNHKIAELAQELQHTLWEIIFSKEETSSCWDKN